MGPSRRSPRGPTLGTFLPPSKEAEPRPRVELEPECQAWALAEPRAGLQAAPRTQQEVGPQQEQKPRAVQQPQQGLGRWCRNRRLRTSRGHSGPPGTQQGRQRRERRPLKRPPVFRCISGFSASSCYLKLGSWRSVQLADLQVVRCPGLPAVDLPPLLFFRVAASLATPLPQGTCLLLGKSSPGYLPCVWPVSELWGPLGPMVVATNTALH